jgi:hypothetical protein
MKFRLLCCSFYCENKTESIESRETALTSVKETNWYCI